jgi:hypothetical protein
MKISISLDVYCTQVTKYEKLKSQPYDITETTKRIVKIKYIRKKCYDKIK